MYTLNNIDKVLFECMYSIIVMLPVVGVQCTQCGYIYTCMHGIKLGVATMRSVEAACSQQIAYLTSLCICIVTLLWKP